MGVRFRKSISIAPGIRINLNKKSVGVSVGNKFGGVSYNTRTGARARVSAPGTGVSYSTKLGSSTNRNSSTSVVVTEIYEEPKISKNKACASNTPRPSSGSLNASASVALAVAAISAPNPMIDKAVTIKEHTAAVTDAYHLSGAFPSLYPKNDATGHKANRIPIK